MEEEARPSEGTAAPDTSPPEATPYDQEADAPPKPVDDPDLPEEGDAAGFEEEPVPEDEFEDNPEGNEQLDEPNDLSEIEREFDEDEDEGDRNPGLGVA